jgi:hypothetical protein
MLCILTFATRNLNKTPEPALSLNLRIKSWIESHSMLSYPKEEYHTSQFSKNTQFGANTYGTEKPFEAEIRKI